MTRTCICNTNRKPFLLLLVFISAGYFSQTKKQSLLRDNHIKKILHYTIEKQNGPKYLSNISFVNDSGFIYRKISLDKNQDTVSRAYFQYDSLGRQIAYREVYAPDSLCYTTSEYPNTGGVRTKESYFGRESTEFEICETKGRKQTCFKYKNDVLLTKTTHVWKRHYIKTKSTVTSQATTKHKGKEHFDANGNITKTVFVSHFKMKVQDRGYTIESADGTVLKDRSKYSTVRQKGKHVTTFKFNQQNLMTQVTFYPSTAHKRRGHRGYPSGYRCNQFEYLTQ